jgi:hypothetical protein
MPQGSPPKKKAEPKPAASTEKQLPESGCQKGPSIFNKDR